MKTVIISIVIILVALVIIALLVRRNIKDEQDTNPELTDELEKLKKQDKDLK